MSFENLSFWKSAKVPVHHSSSDASNAGAFDLIKCDKCDKSVTWQLKFYFLPDV